MWTDCQPNTGLTALYRLPGLIQILPLITCGPVGELHLTGRCNRAAALTMRKRMGTFERNEGDGSWLPLIR